MKMTLTPEELIKLKKVAAILPNLEALVGAPAPRNDERDDENPDGWLERKISGPAGR